MFLCLSGRDDSNTVTALGVSHTKNATVAHAQHVHPFLALVFAIVDPVDDEWIAKHLSRLIEGDAMVAPIRRRYP
jgi:hypothetical protein